MISRRSVSASILLVGVVGATLSTAFLDVERDEFPPVAEALVGVGFYAGPVLVLIGLALLIADLRSARRGDGDAPIERTARWVANVGWTLLTLALAWIPTFVGAALSLRFPEPPCEEKFCIRFATVVFIGGGFIAAVEAILAATLLTVGWLATREPGRRGAFWWLSALALSVASLVALGYAINAVLT